MKFVALAFVLFSTSVFAGSPWSSHEISRSYTSNMTVPLTLDGRTFRITNGSSYKLVEIEELNMLKVFLHKYKVGNCPSSNLETDLELLAVNGKSVGINLVRGCILEVYIEKADHSAESFLD